MKKLIIGFLLSALCISIVGCENTEKKLYEKYKTLIDALESNDYSTATDEFYAINTDTNIQEVTYGEWYPLPSYEENGIESIAIYKNGDCVLNDHYSYTWSLDHVWDNSIELGINTEEKKEFLIRVYKNPDMGYHYMYLERVNGATTSEIIASFYKAEEYTVIDITEDNWNDYFEPFETIKVFRTSVGKFSSFNIERGYKLKDEYEAKLRVDISNLTYDHTSTLIHGLCTVDIEKETYELGEIKSKNENGGLDVTMLSHYLGNDKYSYRFVHSNLYIDELPEDEVFYNIDFKITRMEGKIFLFKDN